MVTNPSKNFHLAGLSLPRPNRPSNLYPNVLPLVVPRRVHRSSRPEPRGILIQIHLGEGGHHQAPCSIPLGMPLFQYDFFLSNGHPPPIRCTKVFGLREFFPRKFFETPRLSRLLLRKQPRQSKLPAGLLSSPHNFSSRLSRQSVCCYFAPSEALVGIDLFFRTGAWCQFGWLVGFSRPACIGHQSKVMSDTQAR